MQDNQFVCITESMEFNIFTKANQRKHNHARAEDEKSETIAKYTKQLL